MASIPRDDEREDRIMDEIIVDCYGPEEQAMGWYNYLNDTLQFPFTARCTKQRATSPLEPGDEVEVIDMADADDCEHEMFVQIRWQRRPLAVPLAQIVGLTLDMESQEAIEDWQYWVKRGHTL
jgi:hypothetical protein